MFLSSSFLTPSPSPYFPHHFSSIIVFIHKPSSSSTASGFMFACLKCYVACVRYRAKKYYIGQKRTTGGMNKTTVMEFFEACNALMAMPVGTLHIVYRSIIIWLRLLQYCLLVTILLLPTPHHSPVYSCPVASRSLLSIVYDPISHLRRYISFL